MNKCVNLLVGVLLLVVALSLTGCKKEITKKDIWKDPDLDMKSLSMTKDELKNRRVRARNTTWRQIHDDWDRIWLQNRPLYLSDRPIP